MDDYYDLLGVDADASTDEIRSAYRELKQGLDSSTEDGAKARKAKLNKAWNVLSDPYQRGRYDEQRERGVIADDADYDGDEPSDNGSSVKKAATKQPEKRGRQARELPPPTIQPPAGTHYPQPKQRIIAMAIDLGVLFVLVVASQFLIVSLQKSNERAAYDTRTELVDTKIPAADDNLKAAKDELKTAQAATPVDQADVNSAQAKVDTAQTNRDDLGDQLSAAEKKLAPISQLVTGIVFLLGFLYLVVPSFIWGATVGKRRQHLKLLREDGSPARKSDIIKRYGVLVLVTYLLNLLIPVIGAVIVLFIVTMWMRNNNQQGLHDRFTHTIVVAEDRQD